MIADPADRAAYLLWQTAHLVSREITTALADSDLTAAQFGALVHITREPGVSAADVARRINLTPQAVQTALRPLLGRGLIERRPHPVHRKILGIFPTEHGCQLTQTASEAVATADATMLNPFSRAESEQLRDLLRRALLSLNPTALDRSSLRSPVGTSKDTATER